MKRLVHILWLAGLVLAGGPSVKGAAPVAVPRSSPSLDNFRPDPRSVQRWGPAYRYPQAGWIVLHIEGEPYARGEQHGRLLAPEIAAHIRCFAATQAPKDPAAGWKLTRTLCNALFLRGYEKEYLEEMKGIAAGASAAGAKFDGRPVDLLDIVALNAWAEVDTLEAALDATPGVLEGTRFPRQPRGPEKKAPPKPARCSAFAATGPATRDGKVVFGHITMFNLYPSGFYNVWLDVKPNKGHRVLMQTYPGGIQSGLDYYLNDAGLLVCETTIAQTHFDARGAPVVSRIRQALQYADSIDKAVKILERGNNGLYTNEWLLADIKTNEIAMFELGTHKSKLWRSSKDEWFGGTRGFYWGCNNTKDADVRLETVAGATTGRPGHGVFVPSERDRAWLRLYDRHKGKIDEGFGKLAFTTPPLAAFPSVDAKFTTSAMAKELKTWALFGPPLGRTWQPTFEEKRDYPEVRPLVSNPWAVLHAEPPERRTLAGRAEDLHDPAGVRKVERVKEDELVDTEPAWRGTLLPRGDGDLWLALGSSAYEPWAALDNALRQKELTERDKDRLGVALFGHRAVYELGARAREEVPLVKVRSDFRHDDQQQQAAGKGALLLHALRGYLGAATFDEMMDGFGQAHGGTAVSTEQFRAFAEKKAGRSLSAFFDAWLHGKGLPTLKLGRVTEMPLDNCTVVEVQVLQEGGGPGLRVPVTVQTHGEPVTEVVELDGKSGKALLVCDAVPLRVEVDRHGLVPKSNGGPFGVLTFDREPEEALIVYGTATDEAAQRESAQALQQALRRRWWNVTVPMVSDREVKPADLSGKHLLLIGRPSANGVTAKLREALPVTFGDSSFRVRGETYAHPNTAVLAAGANPANRRYSVVVIAGLQAASTRQAVEQYADRKLPEAEVVVLPAGGGRRALVVPARELVRDLGEVKVEME